MEDTRKRGYRTSDVTETDNDALRDALMTMNTAVGDQTADCVTEAEKIIRSDAAYRGLETRLRNRLKGEKPRIRKRKPKLSYDEMTPDDYIRVHGLPKYAVKSAEHILLAVMIASGVVGISKGVYPLYKMLNEKHVEQTQTEKQPDYRKGFKFGGTQYKVVRSRDSSIYRGW